MDRKAGSHPQVRVSDSSISATTASAQVGRANARLEESRVQRERFAAQQQRVSVAREIHDVVAHSLTVVIVQADGAEYAAEHAQPWDRTDAGKVLATIGRTARSALTEVRSVIDVLRETGEPDEPQGARAGAAELRHLIDSVRAAGLPVEVDADPAAFDEIPAPVDLPCSESYGSR